jgi:hypothetical protein
MVMSRSLFCVAVATTLLILALCICPYSPAGDEKWMKKADMAVPRIAHSSVAVDGKIYS